MTDLEGQITQLPGQLSSSVEQAPGQLVGQLDDPGAGDVPIDDIPYTRRNREWSDGNLYFDALGSAQGVQGNLTAHEGNAAIHFADTPGADGIYYVRQNRAWINAATLYDPLGSAAAVQSNLTAHEGDGLIHFADGPAAGDAAMVRRNRSWSDGALYFDALGSADAVQVNLNNHSGNTVIHFDDTPAADAIPYVRRNRSWVNADNLYDALGSADAVQSNLTTHEAKADIHFADNAAATNAVRNAAAWIDADTLYPNGWVAETTVLVPTQANQAIGLLEKTPLHVAVGEYAPGTEGGSEGLIGRVANTDGGGLVVMGSREDPAAVRTVPLASLKASAPLHLKGTAIALEGVLGLIVANPITKDHYLKAGPTVPMPDGQLFSPIELGPEIIYTNTDQIQDTRDIQLTDGVEVDIFIGGLTLTNSYTTAGQYSSQVSLQEVGGREVTFTLRYYVDDIQTGADETISLNGSSTTFINSAPLQQALSAGQVVRMTVEATNGHQQSDGWVRGQTNLPSQLQIQEVV